MRVKTLQADSVGELDSLMGSWLSDGWELMGDMGTYRYKRQHAVHGYDVWETRFTQRVVLHESA